MGWNFCALPGQSQFNKCGSFWTYSSNKKKDTSLMRTHFRGPVVSKIERFHFITLACHFLFFFFPLFPFPSQECPYNRPRGCPLPNCPLIVVYDAPRYPQGQQGGRGGKGGERRETVEPPSSKNGRKQQRKGLKRSSSYSDGHHNPKRQRGGEEEGRSLSFSRRTSYDQYDQYDSFREEDGERHRHQTMMLHSHSHSRRYSAPINTPDRERPPISGSRKIPFHPPLPLSTPPSPPLPPPPPPLPLPPPPYTPHVTSPLVSPYAAGGGERSSRQFQDPRLPIPSSSFPQRSRSHPSQLFMQKHSSRAEDFPRVPFGSELSSPNTHTPSPHRSSSSGAGENHHHHHQVLNNYTDFRDDRFYNKTSGSLLGSPAHVSDRGFRSNKRPFWNK